MEDNFILLSLFINSYYIIGATAHYAIANLDAVPIFEEDLVRVSHRNEVDILLIKGKDLERIVLARAVRSHLQNRVLVYGNRTVVFECFISKAI